MARLTATEARALVNVFCIPPNRDFHALNSQHVRNILDAARSRNYRRPRGANGSTARQFYAYLMRALNQESE